MGLLCLTFVKLKIFHSKRWTLRCIMPTENILDPLYIHSKTPYLLPTTGFLQGTIIRCSVMATNYYLLFPESRWSKLLTHFISHWYLGHSYSYFKIMKEIFANQKKAFEQVVSINNFLPVDSGDNLWMQLLDRKYHHQNWGTLISWCWGSKRNVSAVEGRSLTLSWQILCPDCK